MAKNTVILVGTLDTKGPEYAFVKERIEEMGVDVFMVDAGISNKPMWKPDMSAEEVAAAAGLKLDELYSKTEETRGNAIKKLSEAVGITLKKLIAQEGNNFGAVLALGGTGGTAMMAPAFRGLPLGFPKMLVSTVASGNTKEYVGTSDMIMMNSVTDIAGLNRISGIVLANAAHAAAGMAMSYEATKRFASGSKPLVGITMFGVTTPCVLRIREQLEAKGFDIITFHAVGQGAAMEELIDAGIIDGVIDLTLPEIINCKLGGIFSAGPDRMNAAVRKGIPMVVSLGAAECFNFGAPNTIPAEFNTPERKVIVHNPQITSLLANDEEMKWIGQYVADHVNAHPGSKAVIIPTLGLDNYQSVGSQWFTETANEPLFQAVRDGLNDDIELVEKANHINDPVFADAVFALFMKVWGAK